MNPICSTTRNQVTILGINSLFGKVVSFLLKQSPVANRLVLYDEADTRVAHDIAEIPTPCKVVVYDGEEQLRCAVKNSDVILIGDKDDCLAGEEEAIRQKAADIVRYAQAISSIAPNAIILIAATPVNSLLPLFTEAQIGCGTFDCDRVMGVTSADTMRASTLLARHMGIDPEKAYLPVIGGSSADTRIPLFSQSRPTISASKSDLKNLTRIVKMTEENLKMMLNRGEALNKAYATVQLIDSVMSALRGQRNISEIVLSRTCLVPNVDYFSLPVILGPRGIAHRFPLPSLTERESILLDHAVKHIEIDKMKGINALSGDCTIPQPPEMTEKYSELINVCQNDYVGSLMEKFKIGEECPEVREPRVEYKLLSKVKLKLPPESKPSEMPKRTKFIEPDTPPQDGCCPLKLPCPPIPPIRGLNQIQAKHTCKSREKPKACKCFFPPVEKALEPCKLCPSSRPCVDYGDFKTFYEEHRHCCGPVTCTEEISSGSEIALITPGSFDSQVLDPISSDQLASSNEANPPVITNPIDTKSVELMTSQVNSTLAQQPKQMSFQALAQYPKAEAQHAAPAKVPQATLSDTQKAAPALAQQSAVAMPKQTHNSTISRVNPQNSSQPADPNIQHDDPNWPFKCSTTICLDALTPKTPSYQTAANQSLAPWDQNSKQSYAQKETQLQNSSDSLKHASTILQSTQGAQPIQDKNSDDKEKPHKRYNYSSGLSITNPQNIIEEISTGNAVVEGIGERMTENQSGSSQRNELVESSTYSQNCSQPHPSSFSKTPSIEINNKIESISADLKKCYNRITALSTQKLPGRELSKEQGSVNVESHSVTIKHPGISEEMNDHKVPTGDTKFDHRNKRDDNAKRRLYASLKVIEDIKPVEKPSEIDNSQTRQHFHNDVHTSRVFKSIQSGEPGGSSQNTMISILRDRAKAINANIELQRDLRASMDRSKRKGRKDNLTGLIDTINPVKRLPKRLESRPALRKTYRGVQKLYGDPRYLVSQGKSSSILVTPKPGHEEKSLVPVDNPTECKRASSRVERIKARIQEALKKIIFPVDNHSGIKPAEKISRHQQTLSQKLVTRPAMRKSSKAKQDFFVEMRKRDPAYRPTTRMYAAKCPTRLLYDDHPKNHSNMVTFNNVQVIEDQTTGGSPTTENNIKLLPGNTSMHEDTISVNRSYVFPDVPDFPDLNLRDIEPKITVKENYKSEVAYSQGKSMPTVEEPKRFSKDDVGKSGINSRNLSSQETKFSGQIQLEGDYTKHFNTKALPKNLEAILPELIKAAVKERSRNVVTPGSSRYQRHNDIQYGMTSPNRLKYTRKPS